MSETTTNTNATQVSDVDRLMALLRDPATAKLVLKDPTAAAAFGQAVKEERDEAKERREHEAAEQAARFAQIVPSVRTLVDDIHTTHEAKDFVGRKGKRAGKVTGRGYQTTGVAVLPDDKGVMRETRVTVFIKWNPQGGSAPADVVLGDENDD